jgi:thiamine pyrophosphokinase
MNGDSSVVKKQSSRHALILANGIAPKKPLFNILRREAVFFVCADGGANSALKLHTTPDLIVGDFDSIEPETLKAFRSVRQKHITDQNSTDLEKAFRELLKKGYKTITVLGATGGRFDHAIGNLSALAKFSLRADITFVDDSGFYFLIKDHCVLALPERTIISLIPLSFCSGITTTGLRWNLKNESLQLGVRESTSNIAVTSQIKISVRAGNLIAYILHPKL